MEKESINKPGESINGRKIYRRSAKSIINFNPTEIAELNLGDATLELDDSQNRALCNRYARKESGEADKSAILRRIDPIRILEGQLKDCSDKGRSKVVLSKISLTDTHSPFREETLAAWNVILGIPKWELRIRADNITALSLIDEIPAPDGRVEICLTLTTDASEQWDKEQIAKLSDLAEKGYKISVILLPRCPILDWDQSLRELFQCLPKIKTVWANCGSITSKESNNTRSGFDRETATRYFYTALEKVASEHEVKFHFILGYGCRSYWWKEKAHVVPKEDEQEETPAPRMVDEIKNYLKKEGVEIPSEEISKLLGRIKQRGRAEIDEHEAYYSLCHLGNPSEEQLKDRKAHFFSLCQKHWKYSDSHIYRLYDAGSFLAALKKKNSRIFRPKDGSQVAALLVLAEPEDQLDCWITLAETLPVHKLTARETKKEVRFYAERYKKKLKPRKGNRTSSLAALKKAKAALLEDFPDQTEFQEGLDEIIQKVSALPPPTPPKENLENAENNEEPTASPKTPVADEASTGDEVAPVNGPLLAQEKPQVSEKIDDVLDKLPE